MASSEPGWRLSCDESLSWEGASLQKLKGNGEQKIRFHRLESLIFSIQAHLKVIKKSQLGMLGGIPEYKVEIHA